MRLILYIIFLTVITSFGYSQKEAYNWYFGSNAGITFNTAGIEPDAVLNGALNSQEGCASISDAIGRLLFYTDGETVWNKNHVPMPAGSGLFGNKSSTQSAIIIPQPGSSNIYYIITTDDSNGTKGCRYSVVDLNLSGGLGDLTQKNILLFNESTEKLVGIKHANGRDWWVLSHEWNSDVFRAYLISPSGINTFAVFSISGSQHHGALSNKTGYLKANLNGTKLALVLPDDGIIELFEFDNSKGRVHRPINLSSQVFKDAYGLEFSKSGRKLYVSKRENPSAILQFDISSWSQSAILNSQTLIYDIKEQGAFQAMQIGPDNKIYVSRNQKTFLGRINNPESPGKSCNYIDSSIWLKGQRALQGLPNIYSSDLIKLNIKSNSPVCIRDSLRLFAPDVFGAAYSWVGPNGFSSEVQNPVVYISSNGQSGYYILKMNVSDVEFNDSTFVEVSASPNLSLTLNKGQPVCDGDSVIITAVTSNGNTILWNTGDTTKSIVVRKSGKYSATVTNSRGCSATADSLLTFTTVPTKIVPLGATEFCTGDSVELLALPLDPGAIVTWSTGESGQSIIVKETSKIILTVRTMGGCTKYDTIQVKKYDNLLVEMQILGQFCTGDTVELSTNYKEQEFLHLWSTGERSPSIKITNDSKGWVYVRLKSGCGDTAFFDYSFNTKPDLLITSDKSLTSCKGDTVTLSAIIRNTAKNVSYLWSTGETSKSIKVMDAGRYSVTATTDSGCSSNSYVDVFYLESPDVQIVPNGPTNLCEGDFLQLSAAPIDNQLSYLWSTGETTSEITVNKTGKYFVVATNALNCSDTASIEINFQVKPLVEIQASGPLRLCEGNTVTLGTYENYDSYIWSTGETSNSIIVQEAGQYWVTVVDSNGCSGRSDEIDVTVSKVDIEIADLSKSKFGNVCVSNKKVQEVIYSNNSKEAIFVQAVTLSTEQHFTIETEPLLPAVIPVGREIMVIITFEPVQLGNYTDTMKLTVSSPCFYEFGIILEGSGVARTTSEVPEVEIPIGSSYCIPLFMTLDCGDTLNERIYFSTSISLDLSMFLPDTILHPFVTRTYISGSRRVFEIDGYIDSLGKDKTQILEICGTVMYGNYEWDPILLGNFIWDKPNLSTVSISGELEIYGLCEFDISRIKFINQTTMKIKQFDNSGKIELLIGTEEIGVHHILVSDLNGRVVFSQDFEKTDNEYRNYEFLTNLPDYYSGYFIVSLRSPNSISSLPLIIYR